METLTEYWTGVGIALALVLNAVTLFRLWTRTSDKENGDFRLPIVFTVLFFGAVGMIGLGRGELASANTVHLEGNAAPEDQRAVEKELQNQKELVFQTRAELEQSRQENTRLKQELEKRQFNKDVEDGQDHMKDFRDRIINREQSKTEK